MPQDYYSILGVPHNAGDKEVRSAFRKLARKYHPDVNRDEADAEKRFKEINEANEVLSDPEKRRLYDRYGHNWRQAQQYDDRMGGSYGPFGRSAGASYDFGSHGDLFGGSGLDDVLGRFFGGRGGAAAGKRAGARRVALEQPVELSLEEAYSGAARMIQVTSPNLAQPIKAEVTVPAGVEDGARVRVAPGGQEVILVVSVRPHPRFQRHGADLSTEVTVPFTDAMLGGEAVVPTLAGRVALTLPQGTQNGRVFLLRGQGMPRLQDSKARGDLHVTVMVSLPTDLTEEETDLIRRLRESLDKRSGGAADASQQAAGAS